MNCKVSMIAAVVSLHLIKKWRSEILEVFSEDFDWRSNLKNAADDFNAFDSLKRHCAHLIRAEKQMPDDLKHWIADKP